VVSLDGCVHNCALRSSRFGSVRQLKPHSQTERTHLWYCGVLLFRHFAILLKHRSVKNCCQFRPRCFCFTSLVESLHLNTLVCNLHSDWKLNTRRGEQLTLYMTTSCSPSFLNGRITKNCTYCRLSTTHFPSFPLVRGLTGFLVGGVGYEDSNRMFSTKSRHTAWDIFLWGWQSRKRPDQKHTHFVNRNNIFEIFCRCSSWFLKEKRSVLSKLQKCAKCWGRCWNLTLNDNAWNLNSTDIIYIYIYSCIGYYV